MVERRLENVKRILSNGFHGKTRWAVTGESQLNPDTHHLVTVSQKVWGILMYAFIVARMDDGAENLWATILRIGYSPNIDIWNSLLEGYRDTHQVERLLLTWDVMKKERIPLNATSYGARIACLFQARRATLAMKTFEEFKRAHPNQEDGLIFVFNTILNGYLLERRLTDAVKLFEEMKKHGPQPDIVSYNTFIAHYAKRADLHGVADFVRQLTEAGVEPDVFTFTTILSAILKAGIPNGTARLLEVMDSMGVKQNVATYSAIINSQVREGTREGVKTAWELLQQMERMKDTRPNIVTYTSFLAGVHRSQELDKQLVALITSEVVKTMKRRGVQLKLGTYHVLFKACLENSNPEGMDFFMDYYNMLVRSGIPFRHDTWYIILNGLIRRDAWTLAKEMKDRMLSSGFQPMWGVMEMVKWIEEWEAGNR
ncbi:uncharacterized protein FOMMEDRAFT_19211 [Fomitiporia mediterranea MF3/22]|uniref:uncharacterized protein n=1 Tax=Fomitiporia mediterranea (strain MF3/22) TaxID=694068 RepID=UPI0004407EF3|nr:uncharacterized protein FOMMEDRAFT_19211 [Fomitiporia mediterranea MF3/22]EJD03877.1 hypothetical protein FOMMEDRAFT_19211 [Fomitiporia mediterranea MF3/22]